MTTDRHAGPPCPNCALPRATTAAWAETGPGEREDLCWAERECAAPAYDWVGEVARLRAKLARVTGALQGTPVNLRVLYPHLTSVAPDGELRVSATNRERICGAILAAFRSHLGLDTQETSAGGKR